MTEGDWSSRCSRSSRYILHAARDDTDLIPQLRKLVSSNEYDAMAEELEKKGQRLFGEDGFEQMVQRVARVEPAIEIHDVNQFTPRTYRAGDGIAPCIRERTDAKPRAEELD
jgi:hypothetical protein